MPKVTTGREGTRDLNPGVWLQGLSLRPPRCTAADVHHPLPQSLNSLPAEISFSATKLKPFKSPLVIPNCHRSRSQLSFQGPDLAAGPGCPAR